MSEDNRWFEKYTQDETPEEQAERLAHTINFMADPALGNEAVQLMAMIHVGIKQIANTESHYILESSSDEPPYFQVIRDPETQDWYAELSHPAITGVKQTVDEMITLKSLGWLEPNSDSPNWHREYSPETPIYQIAADGAEGFIKGFGL